MSLLVVELCHRRVPHLVRVRSDVRRDLLVARRMPTAMTPDRDQANLNATTGSGWISL
jgi:hypothetical protein